MESDRIDWTGVYIYCTGGEGPPEISFKMKKKKRLVGDEDKSSSPLLDPVTN